VPKPAFACTLADADRQGWWDMEGMQKPLHSFNALRIPFLCAPVPSPSFIIYALSRSPSRSLLSLSLSLSLALPLSIEPATHRHASQHSKTASRVCKRRLSTQRWLTSTLTHYFHYSHPILPFAGCDPSPREPGPSPDAKSPTRQPQKPKTLDHQTPRSQSMMAQHLNKCLYPPPHMSSQSTASKQMPVSSSSYEQSINSI
jgi:hypothetical protein